VTHVGIDVSKKILDVAALDDNGEVSRAQFNNSRPGRDACLTWLESFKTCKVALEATGTYHQHLVALLQMNNIHVSVINPAQVSYFIKSQHRRNKTDKADALSLALYGKERQPEVSTSHTPMRQSLAREIEALTQDIVRLKNRLEAAREGITHPKVVASLKRRIKALQEEKEGLEVQLRQEVKASDPDGLSLLTSIPGVGVRTACLLLTELGDIRRFSSARSLVAYAGLTPERYESGSSVHKRSRITRMGSRHLRKILYMPALSGLRYNPSLQRFYRRLVERNKAKKAALVACMAKLLRIVFAVLTYRTAFDPSYAEA
jgi:transposase